MKNKIIIFLLSLLLTSTQCFAAWDATKPANNEKLKDTPALIRANWDAIATGTDSALLVTNAKVSASAAIVDTKIATISTAGKVDATAITDLPGLPSGAGAVPIANGGSGQTTRAASINALMPSQTSNSGKSAITDGTDVSWGYPAGLTIASMAQGDTLFVNSTPAVARLGAGTSGMFLKTQGAGANPIWAKVDVSDTSNITGTIAVGNGGTGNSSYTNGQILIGNTTGNTLTKTTLTAGSGISVTNGSGSITIASTATSPNVTAFTNVQVSCVMSGGSANCPQSTTISSTGDWDGSKKFVFIGNGEGNFSSATTSAPNWTSTSTTAWSGLAGAYSGADGSTIVVGTSVSLPASCNNNGGSGSCSISQSGGNLVIRASSGGGDFNRTCYCSASGILIREP